MHSVTLASNDNVLVIHSATGYVLLLLCLSTDVFREKNILSVLHVLGTRDEIYSKYTIVFQRDRKIRKFREETSIRHRHFFFFFQFAIVKYFDQEMKKFLISVYINECHPFVKLNYLNFSLISLIF